MIRRANPRVVGGFVVGAVVLAVIVFLVFGSGKYFVEKQMYVVYFPSSVSGLSSGDPVKVKGITIGSVKKVEPLFSPEGEFHAEVFVEIQGQAVKDLSGTPEQMTNDEIMTSLFVQGLRAQLGVASLITGKQYVNLDLYPGTQAVFMGFNDDYMEIPAVPTRTEELQGTLEDVIATIQDLDIRGLVESTKSTLASIDTLASMPEIKTTITTLNHVLLTTDTLMTNMNTELAQISADLRQTSSALSATAERAQTLFARIDHVVVEEEMEFRETMNELEKAARALRLLAEEIEKKPSSLIFGKDD